MKEKIKLRGRARGGVEGTLGIEAGDEAVEQRPRKAVY